MSRGEIKAVILTAFIAFLAALAVMLPTAVQLANAQKAATRIQALALCVTQNQARTAMNIRNAGLRAFLEDDARARLGDAAGSRLLAAGVLRITHGRRRQLSTVLLREATADDRNAAFWIGSVRGIRQLAPADLHLPAGYTSVLDTTRDQSLLNCRKVTRP